jgi:pimeloyl-ACP methyl ester carboxylesterase
LLLPEYLPPQQRDYHFSAASHHVVLSTLRDARLRFAIDSERVFLAGHNAGGDAAYDLGLTHPDEFAGVIPLGGICEEVGRYLFDNGKATAWYLVRGELGRDGKSKEGMNPLLDRMFVHGAKYDLVYCQYLGRGLDSFPDELPRLFDWMDLQRRKPQPKDFEYKALRQADDRIFWVTSRGLPRNYALSGSPGPMDPMRLEARITEGNTVYIRSPASSTTLRLSGELIDLDKKLSVRINARQRFSQFVEAETATILEDFRSHGDAERIADVLLEF